MPTGLPRRSGVSGASGRVLAAAGSDVSVVNSTTATALATLAIPAGLVAAGDLLELDAVGDLLNNTGGAVNFTFRLKLGATTLLATAATALGASATRRTWNLGARLYVVSPSVQRCSAKLATTQANTGWTQTSTTFDGYGSAAEDLTAAKNVVFEAEMGTANASADVVLHAAALRYIKKA